MPTFSAENSLSNKWREIVFLFVDMIIFNLLLYYFIKSLLFYPVGYASVMHVALWGVLFSCGLYASSLFKIWGKRLSLRGFSIQLGSILLFAFIVYRLSSIEPKGIDLDWSWLIPEIIKTPLWLKMFVFCSPIFTLLFFGVVFIFILLAVTNPKSRTLRIPL